MNVNDESLPARIADEALLEDLLSAPTAAMLNLFGRLDGDVLILGVAGKMGPSLAHMARRAMTDAGAAYTTVDSTVSLTFATNCDNPAWDFRVYLRRTTGTVVEDFLRSQTYGRWGNPTNFQRVVPLLGSPAERP